VHKNPNNIVVQITNLVKHFKSESTVCVQAVNNISLKVSQNEILLIGGPNGSGKTTLLTMIGCMMKPTSGEIRIIDKETTQLPQPKLTKFRLHHIGFVFQTFRLIDSLTVQENVELVFNLSGIGNHASKNETKLLLDEMHMLHRANSFPITLSGGEKQRVAIARALANNPILILADEPTGSLDSKSGKKTMELLRGIADKKNTSIIIVSHDERINNYADRIITMEDGQITREL